MTSLAGFEALLHQKRVITYGLPFYAGWGLTQDRHAIHRRGRKLALDELVAAALILYPRYIDWHRGYLVQVESILEHLTRKRNSSRYRSGTKAFRWGLKLAGFLGGVF
jgi:capsular polysaccharide export protein